MAYLLDIFIRKCADCHVKAKVNLFNRFNSLMGSYCKYHGRRRLQEAEKKKA